MNNVIRRACLGAAVASVGLTTILISAPAGAISTSPSQGTTMTVTSSRPDATTALTGSSVTFRAQLAPTIVPPRVHITGTVAWTVTGNDGSTITCGKTTPLRNNGRVTCKVGPGQIQASASPYTVTASYSGDANFQASSGTFSQTVGLRTDAHARHPQRQAHERCGHHGQRAHRGRRRGPRWSPDSRYSPRRRAPMR